MRVILAMLLCCSCWGHVAPWWDVAPGAGFRRMAAAGLTMCVQNNRCVFVTQCFAESSARCIDAGYEPTCGQMEPEGSCGVNVK